MLVTFLYVPPKLTLLPAVLWRSSCLEETEAPEHRVFPGGHNDTFTNCIGVDAKWYVTGVLESQLLRGSNGSGECATISRP